MLAIPHTGEIRTELFLGILKMMTTKKDNVTIFAPLNIPHDHNRNVIVKEFLSTDIEWLIMVDSDVVIPQNLLDLVTKGKPIISGRVVVHKNKANYLMALLEKDGRLLPLKELNTPQQVDAVGTGCIAIHRSVLEKLEPPYFKFVYDKDGLVIYGEDFYFCKKAIEAGFEIWATPEIDCYHVSKVALHA